MKFTVADPVASKAEDALRRETREMGRRDRLQRLVSAMTEEE